MRQMVEHKQLQIGLKKPKIDLNKLIKNTGELIKDLSYYIDHQQQ